MALAHMDWTGSEKIGAIVFFREFTMVSPPIKRRRLWRVIVNPTAQVQIPEALLNGLESLDESSFWGSRRRPERLVAAMTPRRPSCRWRKFALIRARWSASPVKTPMPAALGSGIFPNRRLHVKFSEIISRTKF
jgi:hypothetical protein